ncbi:MAG: hypothetical protein ACRD2C_12195 [Acidimicrobiales bacterium]
MWLITDGYSPYFNKYGNADFAGQHARYVAAERAAQNSHAGLWDQVAVNGSDNETTRYSECDGRFALS